MDNLKDWTSMPDLVTRAFCRKTGRQSLLNHPSRPPDDLFGQGTELLLNLPVYITGS